MRYVALALFLAALLTGCNEVASSPEPAALLSEQPDPFLEGSTPRVRLTVLEGTKDAPAIGTARVRIEARWDSSWARSRDTALIVGASTFKGIQIAPIYNGNEYSGYLYDEYLFFSRFRNEEQDFYVTIPCSSDSLSVIVFASNRKDSLGIPVEFWNGKSNNGASEFSEQTIYCGK